MEEGRKRVLAIVSIGLCGVNTPGTMFPDSVPRIFDFPEADFRCI
jgi:hypothetical protein